MKLNAVHDKGKRAGTSDQSSLIKWQILFFLEGMDETDCLNVYASANTDVEELTCDYVILR